MIARGAPAPERPAPAWGNVARLLAAVLAPSATVVGLFYYFGYVRTQALFGYFGIDANLLDFAPQDYLVRSAGVAFKPVGIVLLAALLGYAAWIIAERSLAGRGADVARRGAIGALAVGLVFLATGAYGLELVGASVVSPRISAASLIAGSVLLEFAAHLHGHGASRGRGAVLSGESVVVRRAVLTLLVMVGLFWATAAQASLAGQRFSAGFERSLADRPEAVVLTTRSLQSSDLVESRREEFAGTEGNFRFRYSDLHLLIYRNQRWFMLPTGWSRSGQLPVLVIFDDPDDIRVEVRP